MNFHFSGDRRASMNKTRRHFECFALAFCFLLFPEMRLTAQVDRHFTEISKQALPASFTGSHGIAFCDVNRDGLPDFYVTCLIEGENQADRLFINQDGAHFTEEGQARGASDFDGGSHGVVFADLNGDGWFDLFNGSTLDTLGEAAHNNLLFNVGNGYFHDETTGHAAVLQSLQMTRGVAALDCDADGDLDLFSVNDFRGSQDPTPQHNEAFLNQDGLLFTGFSAGSWQTVAAGQGLTDVDIDHDGDVDILACNRTGMVTWMCNDGTGHFVKRDPGDFGVMHRGGDGITVGDVTGNGRMDLLLASSWPKTSAYLYCQGSEGQFTLRQTWTDNSGYMGGLADLDNDGDLDLVFAGQDGVLVNDGAGQFDPGPALYVDNIVDPRSIAFADIDNDGDLDFGITDKQGDIHLIRNDWAQGNWLKVRLNVHGRPSGSFGAKLQCRPSQGPLLYREACSTTGYLAQNDAVLHWGLDMSQAFSLLVELPTGERVIRADMANQTLEVSAADLLLRVRCLLEGALLPQSMIMRTVLAEENMLPRHFQLNGSVVKAWHAQQPFVDWVQVDLFSGDSQHAVCTREAMLRADGWLIDPVAGDSLLAFEAEPGAYTVQIRHRNHLSVRTASAVALTSQQAVLADFTRIVQRPLTGTGLVALANGYTAMVAGDADADGSVLARDLALTSQAASSAETGYILADLNLDGIADASDQTMARRNMLLGQFSRNERP